MNCCCKRNKIKFLLLTVLLFSSVFLPAEEKKEAAKNIRNIAAYAGVLNCEYENDYGKKADESVMYGLYMQWINPELFQLNSFIYGSGDNFNETFIGFHLMGDWYIKHPLNGKYALGAGFEFLKPDADISEEEAGTLTYTELENNLYIPYIRAGRYFNFNIGKSSAFSVFHWAGYQMVISRGNGTIEIDPAGPVPLFTASDFKTDNETSYAIAGIKLGLNIVHIIDLSFKYKASMNNEDFFNTVDTMANFYFTRNLGISLRHKFMENEYAEIDYSIFGVSYSF